MTITNSQIIEVNVAEVAWVSPLPQSVRSRWSQTSALQLPKDSTIEEIEKKLEEARQRREDFNKWTMSKGRDKTLPRQRLEMQRQATQQKLEERLAAAAAKRADSLADRRNKAAASTVKREAAAERLAEKAEMLQQKLQDSLKAAQERKLALQQAEKERLSAAHELILTKLSQVQQQQQEEAAALSARVDAKLELAGSLRESVLATAAAREGAKVEKARRVKAEKEVNERLERDELQFELEERLASAEHRRQAYLAMVQQASKSVDYLQRQAVRREQLRLQVSTRRVQHLWREFSRSRRTTNSLASAFASTGIAGVDTSGSRSTLSSELDSFEPFATRLQSQTTLTAATNLLSRIETKLKVRGLVDQSCTLLLSKLYPSMKNKSIPRYPVRVFLCAFMVVHHPDEVLDASKERERAVITAAHHLVSTFQDLLVGMLTPARDAANRGVKSSPATPAANRSSAYGSSGVVPEFSGTSDEYAGLGVGKPSLQQVFDAFDGAWLEYLDMFVTWKGADASALESDLIRMAVELEKSMVRKCGYQPDSQRVAEHHDLSAMVEQVRHDHSLFRERLLRLTGPFGVARLEAALKAARTTLNKEAESAGINPTEEPPSDSERSAIISMSRSSSDNTNSNTSSPPRPAPPLRHGSLSSQSQASPPATIHHPSSTAQSPGGADGLGAFSNEAMIMEMLHDPSWKLPTADLETAWEEAVHHVGRLGAVPQGEGPSHAGLDPESLQAILRKSMERALWDSISDGLTPGVQLPPGSPSGIMRVSAMLASMGQELKGVVSEGVGQKLVPLIRNLEHDNVVGLLTVDATASECSAVAINVQNLRLLLGQLAQALVEVGSPARAEDLRVETQRVYDEIAAGKGSDPAKDAILIVRCLRMLHVQLQFLKIDLANAKLTMLVGSLGSSGSISYLQTKLLRKIGLSSHSAASIPTQSVQRKVPNTYTFIADAMRSFPDATRHLQQMGYPVDPTSGACGATRQQPDALAAVNLRSGIHNPGRATPTPDSSSATGIKLEGPIGLPGWQAAVRIGLVHLVAGGESTASMPTLPESFKLDPPRLFAVQNEVQQVVVLAACLLILRNLRVTCGLRMSDEVVMDAANGLRELVARSSTGLAQLAASLTELVFQDEGAEAESKLSREEVENRVKSTLSVMLSRDSGAFKAMYSNLVRALYAFCLWGSQTAMTSGLAKGVEATLRRAGAHVVMNDVKSVAGKMQKLLAVQEGVYGPVYKRVYDAIVETESANGPFVAVHQ